MINTAQFSINYPYLALFRQNTPSKKTTFKKSKGGWQCGKSFIPKKSKCFTDPVTGNKLKSPLNYRQYANLRSKAYKRSQSGQSLTEREQLLVQSVNRKQDKLTQNKERSRLKSAAKAAGASQILPGGIAEVDPQKIKVDPKRFQYKLSGANTKSGTVGSLSGVKKWDANLAGIIQVWQDPKDKNVYVVNGHNRLELEKKLGIPKRPARFLKASSAKEARSIGALTNIAEGRGNARDAAKFFRDSGISIKDLEKRGVPLKEKIATDGLALSQLSDGLFNQLIQGELPESRAVIVGSKLKDTTQQEALVKLIAKEEKQGRKITNDVVSELADMTSTAPKKQEAGGNLLTLLGFDPDERSLAIEKAQISASIKRQLNRDKKLFGTVGKSKAAEDLSKAGNRINIEKSAAISANANTTATLFDKTKNQAGEVDKILNKSAERLANGEKREAIAKEAYQEIEEYLQTRFKYGNKKTEFSRKRQGVRRFSSRNARRRNFSRLIYFNNPDSPTYTRRTKTGKIAVVRKGKRKGQNKLVSGAGGLAAGYGAAKVLSQAAKVQVLNALDSGLLDPQNPKHIRLVGAANLGIYAAGAGTAYGVYKKLRGDRGKK